MDASAGDISASLDLNLQNKNSYDATIGPATNSGPVFNYAPPPGAAGFQVSTQTLIIAGAFILAGMIFLRH